MRRLALLLLALLPAGCGSSGEPRVRERPARALAPLPAPAKDGPVFPREDGRVYFGITDNALNEETATPEEIAAIAAGVGAAFVRLDMFWAGVDRGPARYDWTRYDRQYTAFTRAGVRPLWTVLSTPRHAAPAGTRCSGNFCDREPADLGALRTFARAAAERYPLAAAFEYRNEPNLDHGQSCSAHPSWHIPPVAYARSLAAFAQGIRAGRPAMRVIGGALSDCPLGDRPFRYAGAILAAGAAGSMDALSWHPYDDEGSPFAEEARRMEARLPPALRLVAGEVGFLGDPGEQAERLLAQFRTIDAMERYDAFAAFVTVERKAPKTRAYGWVRQKDAAGVFRAKPVYCRFRELLGGAPLPPFVSCG